MEAKENNNQSIICTLYCYTDGDWAFRKEDKQTRDIQDPCFIDDYQNYKANVDEWGDSYEYCFAFSLEGYQVQYLINFLKNLKKDLVYGSHDWARRDIDNMINPAIKFLESKKDGTYCGSVGDGNWQPTALIISVKTLKEVR